MAKQGSIGVLDAEWLRQLLEPALAATLDNDSAALAAASSALTALATLEGLSPGSLQSMMLEVKALLGLHLEACKTCFAYRQHPGSNSSNQQQQHTECAAAYNECALGCA